MRKKLLASVLAIIAFLSMSTSVFAENLRWVKADETDNPLPQDTIISGEHVLTSDEYENYLNSLTKEEIDIFNSKVAFAKLAAKQRNARAAYKISLPGTFTMYQQENDYYCIPATVKSILTYINGSSSSQGSIYGITGQTPTNMPDYLNSKQKKIVYVFAQNPGQELLCTYLYGTIASAKMPASVGISGTTVGAWYYDTVDGGHSLAVNAIYSDYSYVQLADPLGGRVAGCPVYYLKSANILNEYCTRVVF